MAVSDRVYLDLDGAQVSIRGYQAVQEWIQKELAAWAFLKADNRWNGWGIVPNRLNELEQARRNAEMQAQPIEVLAGQFNDYYRSNRTDGLIHSESVLGKQIASINELHGPQAAIFASAFARGRANFGSAATPAETAAGMLLAMPDLIKPDEIAHRQRLERQNDSKAATLLTARLEDEATERAAEWRRLQIRVRALGMRWARRGAKRSAKLHSQNAEAAAASIAQIDATDKAYKESMRLKAPVEYWDDKAKAHGKKEKSARNAVVGYFLLTMLFVMALFSKAGQVLLDTPSVPTQLYVVVGAGLATTTGLLFWIGRLLTRLYLSEHHLRHDAEERAVMTQTYLALTNEQAAEQTDRHIVLNALFRSTPDGIVKDDGPPDANLAAVLSRVLGGPR